MEKKQSKCFKCHKICNDIGAYNQYMEPICKDCYNPHTFGEDCDKRTKEITEKKKFRIFDRVIYIPNHAKGNINHRDCESGVVTGSNTSFVFVRYRQQTQSKATLRKNLVKDV